MTKKQVSKLTSPRTEEEAEAMEAAAAAFRENQRKEKQQARNDEVAPVRSVVLSEAYGALIQEILDIPVELDSDREIGSTVRAMRGFARTVSRASQLPSLQQGADETPATSPAE